MRFVFIVENLSES